MSKEPPVSPKSVDQNVAKTATPSGKRPWSQPRIETIQGREAQAAIGVFGGTDLGIYS
jgi:hypothetical protein